MHAANKSTATFSSAAASSADAFPYSVAPSPCFSSTLLPKWITKSIAGFMRVLQFNLYAESLSNSGWPGLGKSARLKSGSKV